jgi:hypothetical protein
MGLFSAGGELGERRVILPHKYIHASAKLSLEQVPPPIKAPARRTFFEQALYTHEKHRMAKLSFRYGSPTLEIVRQAEESLPSP